MRTSQHRNRRRRLSLAACISLIGIASTPALHTPPVFAQANTGGVYGSVVDAKGLAAPNAPLTIRSTDLASTRTTTADNNGHFRVTGLVPGAYTVEARS